MDIQFTTKAQDALGASVRIAAGNGNPQVDPIHLLEHRADGCLDFSLDVRL